MIVKHYQINIKIKKIKEMLNFKLDCPSLYIYVIVCKTAFTDLLLNSICNLYCVFY